MTKRNGEFVDDPLQPCPECGTGKLVLRQNAKTNHRFMGCTTYPLCTYTTRIFSRTKPPAIVYPFIVCAFTLPERTCEDDGAPLWLVSYGYIHHETTGAAWYKHCSLCHTENFETYSKNINMAMSLEKKVEREISVADSLFTPDPALLTRLKALKPQTPRLKTRTAGDL
jgi:ssDNA-binding Zn-finger/Zn-ribbon topoisomerase 1